MNIGRTGETFIKIGPRGGDHGCEWDDGYFDGVREILIWHGEEINAIQFVYDCKGTLVLSEKHGVDGTNFDHIQLDHPSEYLTEISGCFRGVQPHKPPTVIKSLKFSSNKRSFATFGCGESDAIAASCFHFKVMENKACGFFGRSDYNYLHAIGVHFRAMPKNCPKNSDASFKRVILCNRNRKAAPCSLTSSAFHFAPGPSITPFS
ncbi:jacalin-related lectin 19-like [Ananas comosus]|uniref:Jacalin-related lectin 19-like n=1 Tax=Ananas comosus TaxID=4615 RepID=A0A6P5EVT9_ANACO|nr:jacalin-related lectin 19-like [Ananas comosus]